MTISISDEEISIRTELNERQVAFANWRALERIKTEITSLVWVKACNSESLTSIAATPTNSWSLPFSIVLTIGMLKVSTGPAPYKSQTIKALKQPGFIAWKTSYLSIHVRTSPRDRSAKHAHICISQCQRSAEHWKKHLQKYILDLKRLKIDKNIVRKLHEIVV